MVIGGAMAALLAPAALGEGGCAPTACSACNASEAKCTSNQCEWVAANASCRNPAAPCPCADPSLCRPLSPQPKARQELFAFISAPATLNVSQWELWPWDKITALGSFECLGPNSVRENQCACIPLNRRASR